MKKQGRAVLCLCIMAAILLHSYTLFFLNRSVESFSPSQSGQELLILDAGHGGEDGGAVGRSGVLESDINLAIVRKLENLFALLGQETVLTRSDENAIYDSSAQTLREKKRSDLYNRVDIINSYDNATLISIHQNIYESSSTRGAQVFYATPELSQSFANRLQDTLREGVDPDNDRVAKEIPDSIYLMNNISCRAVLVECGFLSNPEEEQLLQQDSYQCRLAVAIAAAWLNEKGEMVQ